MISAPPQLRAQTVRVMAAFSANWRRQGEHAFDPEGHLCCSFGYHNFAVRSRIPRQVDSSDVTEIEKI